MMFFRQAFTINFFEFLFFTFNHPPAPPSREDIPEFLPLGVISICPVFCQRHPFGVKVFPLEMTCWIFLISEKSVFVGTL